MNAKKLLSLVLAMIMLVGMVPSTIVSAGTSAYYTTTYEKVHSLDEIEPNQRYIIIGVYTNPDTEEVSYHAMGKENYRNDGFRYSYAQDQLGAHNFDITEDTETVTVYTYYEADYDPILRVRLSPQNDDGRYYFKVDGQGYLCGFSNSTSDGTVGHDFHSCMPISQYTKGETWWYMRMPESGDYAGDWQIVNRAKLGNSYYSYDIMQFTYPYPHSGGQFRAEVAYLEDVGVIDEDERIEHTVDKDTNIWIYREVCAHRDDEVTHVNAIPATCAQAGVSEYWYCSGCQKYFSDEEMTNDTVLEDNIGTPPAHSFNDIGVCTVCGTSKINKTFLKYEESYYSSNMDGEFFIAVGFKDDKAYVMGNKTNPDGSREAVEVTVKPNGAIATDSSTAEFLAFEFDNVTFSPDNGYMTPINGSIIVYDKSLLDAEGLPEPMRYGYGYFFRFPTGGTRYIVFDPESLTFKASSDNSYDGIVLYKEVCAHSDGALKHFPALSPTCTRQGQEEFWYCDSCYSFYQNGDLEAPVTDENGGYIDLVDFTLPATGHSFDDQGVCENCGMKRNVYNQVSSLEQFDNLSEEAYYIIVFKDGDKTYAMYLPDTEYPCDIDSDRNGIVDVMEPDTNLNDIPDCIEEYIDMWWGDIDSDEDGVVEAEEYKEVIGDYNGDEIVDESDYVIFFNDYVYWELYYYYEEQALNAPNFVEVTVNSDGSITIVDEGAMEFQMMESGVWGGQVYDEETFAYEKVVYEIEDTDRIRAAWVPNYWVANSGMLGSYGEGHLMYAERVCGDDEYPGVIDNKNWKISFNSDGTALLVSTWADLDDSAALQLVKYTDGEGNERMTVVGVYGDQWQDSDIMNNVTEFIPAYLYAAEPVYYIPEHTCTFGEWVDDENGETHTRTCAVVACNNSETEEHVYDDETHVCVCGATSMIEEGLGDIDGDGNVTNSDVLAIYRYIYSPERYPLNEKMGDVDGDGFVTNADVLAIYRYIYNPTLYPLG